ncbi:MAG: hypothetical protein PW792_17110 [Acidobacteriaceae bacterium]|nr:hypothetical protein [Acidobacteriaceae bacterium]
MKNGWSRKLVRSLMLAASMLPMAAGVAEAQHGRGGFSDGARRGGRGGSYNRGNDRGYYDHRHDGGIGPGKGALIGGAGGAALGAIFGGGVKGALIGGAAGAGIGAIAGQANQNSRRRHYR